MGIPFRQEDGTLVSEYQAWSQMKTRCQNTNHPAYPLYGGCGIEVCARWQNSYANFYADLGPKPTPEHSLDRIDNRGHYTPENCRWATQQEQSDNRTRGVSGHLGVALHRASGNWVATSASPGRRQLYRGSSLELAIQARMDWDNQKRAGGM